MHCMDAIMSRVHKPQAYPRLTLVMFTCLHLAMPETVWKSRIAVMLIATSGALLEYFAISLRMYALDKRLKFHKIPIPKKMRNFFDEKFNLLFFNLS